MINNIYKVNHSSYTIRFKVINEEKIKNGVNSIRINQKEKYASLDLAMWVASCSGIWKKAGSSWI
jgi:hypothetical protein